MTAGISWPRVDVLDRSGRPLYPPLKELVPATGPVPALVPLHRGARLSCVIYVMVQGPQLRASISTAARGDMARPGPTSTITTPVVQVQLKAEQPLRVTIHTASDTVFAEVQPLPGVHGPLYYVDSVDCGGGSYVATLQWTSTPGTRIAPTCSPPKEWHALVGWLNHPVAHVHYHIAPAIGSHR